jgi:hypothetical protein
MTPAPGGERALSIRPMSAFSTQNPHTTASQDRFDDLGIVLPDFSPDDNLDGVAISYKFSRDTLGAGDVPTNLSQRMFGANGLFPALHPECTAWPEGDVAKQLSVLNALAPNSSALYVEEPVSHANGPLKDSTYDTQGILYVFDKDGATMFEAKLNEFRGSPAKALSRFGTTDAPGDGTAGESNA